MIDLRTASVALVVNEGARRGPGSVARTLAALRRRGVVPQAVHAVASGGALVARLDAALAAAPDVLVVGGGDGSLSAAAGRVAGTSTVLGLLPLGTANDLARTLHLPPSLDRACAVIADGHVVDVDLGRADGRGFVNVASAGLSVGVTQALDPVLKRRLGPAAYAVALARAYRHHDPFDARLELLDDGSTVELPDLLQVAVANGRHHGGGATASPTAGIDDGVLDVYAIRSAGVAQHLRIARSLKDGSFVAHPQVAHLTTRRVRLTTDPPVPLNLDGELEGTTPVTFTVQRNAVHVLVPIGSQAARLDGGPGTRPPGG